VQLPIHATAYFVANSTNMLADRTNGRAFATVFRLFLVCRLLRIVATG